MSAEDDHPQEFPPEEETPSGEEPVTPEDATPSEGGMGTAREEIETGVGMLPEEQPREGDRGMGAMDPILTDEELPATPGAPLAEMEVPPAEAAKDAPLFSEKAYDEPGPTDFSSEAPKPSEIKPANPEMTKLLVTDKDVKELWKRADTAKAGVDEHVGTLVIARDLFDLIKSARNELMAGRDNYEEAERFVNEVEYRVHLSVLLKKWSQTIGIRLFFYELIWGVLLVILALLTLSKGYSSGQQDPIYLFTTMVWGGVGGVVGAWFSLIKHIAQDQDFDIQHTLWYLYTPPMGMLLGLAVWLIMRSGLSAVNGPLNIQSPLLIYFIAWLAGYQHNVFTDLVKRAMKVLETAPAPSSGNQTTSTTTTTTTKPTKPEDKA